MHYNEFTYRSIRNRHPHTQTHTYTHTQKTNGKSLNGRYILIVVNIFTQFRNRNEFHYVNLPQSHQQNINLFRHKKRSVFSHSAFSFCGYAYVCVCACVLVYLLFCSTQSPFGIDLERMPKPACGVARQCMILCSNHTYTAHHIF